jgi:hypothetical protein
MELILTRNPPDALCTIGALAVPAVDPLTPLSLVTMEPVDRNLDSAMTPAAIEAVKARYPDGTTAMPYGRYQVVYSFSPHFNRQMPFFVGVPAFVGCMFHWGQHPENTHGCVMTGVDEPPNTQDLIEATVMAFDKLDAVLKACIARGEKVWCTITKAAA